MRAAKAYQNLHNQYPLAVYTLSKSDDDGCHSMPPHFNLRYICPSLGADQSTAVNPTVIRSSIRHTRAKSCDDNEDANLVMNCLMINEWYEYDDAQGNPAQYIIAACPEGLVLKRLPKAIRPKRHCCTSITLVLLGPIETLLYSLPTNSPSQSGLTFILNVSTV